MRNHVITVPKRRPPSPHSCSKSRSPLRQLAAAKPSQVIRANKIMNMVSATQLGSGTVFSYLHIFFGGKIDDCSKHGADDYPKQLVPIKERHADPVRFNFVVEGWPEDGDELNDQEQVPPAPPAPLATRSVHGTLPKICLRPRHEKIAGCKI